MMQIALQFVKQSSRWVKPATLLSLIALPIASWAEIEYDARGEATIDHWSRYGGFMFDLERSRYSGGEDIPVSARVENRGYQSIRIYPSALPDRTFRFLLLDMQGREVEPYAQPKTFERRELGEPLVNLQGEEIKEVILAPGESFEKRLYLNDHYHLKAGKRYQLSLYFYPDQRFEHFIRSRNRETIHIESHSIDGHSIDRIEGRSIERHSALNGYFSGTGQGPAPDFPLAAKAEPTPQEIVYLFLSAEIQQIWENYFKYLDLPKYITAYDSFSVRYATANERDRIIVLRRFTDYLRKSPGDRLKRFRILGATPERDSQGSVVPKGRVFVRALGMREQGGYQARYEYTYTLERSKGHSSWKIIYVKAQLQ